jgi:hypothetical protein
MVSVHDQLAPLPEVRPRYRSRRWGQILTRKQRERQRGEKAGEKMLFKVMPSVTSILQSDPIFHSFHHFPKAIQL